MESGGSTRKFCQSCEEYPTGAFVCATCHHDRLQKARKKHTVAKKTRDESALQFQDLLVEQTKRLAAGLECQQMEQKNRELELRLKEQRQDLQALQEAKARWETKFKARKLELTQAQTRLDAGRRFRQDRTLPVLDCLEQTTLQVEAQVLHERRKKMEQLFLLFPVTLPHAICGLEMNSPNQDLAFDLVGRVVILASHYLKVPLLHKLSYSKGDVWVLMKSGKVERMQSSGEFFKMMAVDTRMLAEQQGVPPQELSGVDFLVNLHKLFNL